MSSKYLHMITSDDNRYGKTCHQTHNNYYELSKAEVRE